MKLKRNVIFLRNCVKKKQFKEGKEMERNSENINSFYNPNLLFSSIFTASHFVGF